MGLAEQAELVARLSLKDGFSGNLNKFRSGISGAGRDLGRVGKGVGQVAGGLTRLGVVAGVAVAGGLYGAAKASGEFDAQLRTINTILHESEDNLANVGEGIKKLASEGRGELADLSEGFYDVLSAGITDAADAQSVLEAATTLAIGGLSTNAEAVDLLTTAINAYGMEAKDAQGISDLFAKSIEIGKVTADEIASSFANIAPIAAQTGIEIEEVAAAYGALTAQGVPAAAVTTQMQRAILELLKPSKALGKLQKETGKNFFDIAQSKGLVVALQEMRDAVGGNEKDFKNLFGRVEGYKFALATTGPQQEIYNQALKDMGEAAGTASEQMGERTGGLAFQADRLRANIGLAAIELGNGFAPALGRLASRLSDFAVENKSELQAFGRDVGKALDNIDLDSLLDSAKGLVTTFRNDVVPVLKVAWDAFNALPGPVKGLAASLAIVSNTPFLGGAFKDIGSGISNIVKGLAGGAAQAAGRTALGKLVAQPVFVTNWAMIGGAGGAAGAVGGGGGIIGALKTGLALGFAGLAVGQLANTFQDVNNQSTAQGKEVSSKLDLMLARSPTPEALRTAMSGVEEGINRIQSNPLLVLVQGEALDELREMRSKLAIRLKAGDGVEYDPNSGPGGVSSFKQALDRQGQILMDNGLLTGLTRDSIDETRTVLADRINESSSEQSQELGRVRSTLFSQTGSIVGAIRSSRSITNVNVNVTAATVTKSVATQNHYGPGNGSYGSYNPSVGPGM